MRWNVLNTDILLPQSSLLLATHAAGWLYSNITDVGFTYLSHTQLYQPHGLLHHDKADSDRSLAVCAWASENVHVGGQTAIYDTEGNIIIS